MEMLLYWPLRTFRCCSCAGPRTGGDCGFRTKAERRLVLPCCAAYGSFCLDVLNVSVYISHG